MKKFWFSGIWISLPLGLALAFAYRMFILTIRGIGLPPGAKAQLTLMDYKIMVLAIVGTVILIFLANVKKKLWDKEDNFTPFNRRDVTEKSTDKKLAQYRPVPKKYLSREPDGFTTGIYNKKYVRLPFLDSPEHQLVLGAPGSNKSTSILNALIWNYNFATDAEKLRAVLAIDAKPELSKKSIDETRDDIRIINPTSMDAWGFDVWHELDQSSTDDEIKERAETIARALIPTLSGDNIHFSGNAQKLLSGFLMYGFRKGLSFTDSIIQVIHVPVQDLIAQVISDPDMKTHSKIIGKVKSFDGNDSDEFASIKDTLEMNLDIFDTETVKYCFSDNPKKVTPDDLLNGISVYLAIPDHLLTMYKTVFGMIMELCLKHLMSVPEEELAGQRPIWCLVDEGGTIYVPSLLDVASRGRSKKIQLSVVAQSFSQLEDLYGDRQARSIMDCCKTTIVFSCNDTRTARDLSSWTGMYRETKVSTSDRGTVPIGLDHSQSVSQEYRPVMDVSDIKNLEKDNEVLVFAKGDWFLVQKAPYYTIPELKVTSDRIFKRNVRREGNSSDNPFSSYEEFESDIFKTNFDEFL